VGGRYIVLCFFATADAKGRRAIAKALEHTEVFDDNFASFFGVSLDPSDETQGRVSARLPGYRFLWDFTGEISKLYGAIPNEDNPRIEKTPLRRMWFVLDPTLRILKIVPFEQNGGDAEEVANFVRSLPPPALYAGFEVQAPVLIISNVFQRKFCDKLIALYENNGGSETGFMREVEGRTVEVRDPRHKRRRDYTIEDSEIAKQINQRFARAVLPELLKAYQYKATRIERYLVGCYRAEDGGHFAPHRDNTTKGTAHRRFAASVNLNSDFDGGEVSFPEYGPRGFKPPPGGAVVFSCSLLHSVSAVKRGHRYAFLPFIYDDDAAKIRAANNQFLGEDSGAESQGVSKMDCISTQEAKVGTTKRFG
jgi:peroxiredoxin/predicted 2-oxoglutarate/Fe(II)-dependent dioxygenase YbiX